MDRILRCRPLLGSDATHPLCGDDDDAPQGTLTTRAIGWDCADGRLDATVIGAGPLPSPAGDASEPTAAAIARLVHVARAADAILALDHPAIALGPERMALAQGVRLFGITTDADEACWDAALSAGLPVYGLRGGLRIDLGAARRRDATAALLALAYGLFTCGEDLHPTMLEETRSGVAWRFPQPVTTRVIVRDGFEADRHTGAAGAWRDRGTEGYVRLVFSRDDRCCWSQPRLVMAGPTAGASHA